MSFFWGFQEKEGKKISCVVSNGRRRMGQPRTCVLSPLLLPSVRFSPPFSSNPPASSSVCRCRGSPGLWEVLNQRLLVSGSWNNSPFFLLLPSQPNGQGSGRQRARTPLLGLRVCSQTCSAVIQSSTCGHDVKPTGNLRSESCIPPGQLT